MKLRRILIIALLTTSIMSGTILGLTKQKDSVVGQVFSLVDRSPQRSESKQQPKLQILLPLYIYPNWYDRDKYIWQQVILAAKKVPITAIINPNNGPDRSPPNVDYQQGLKDLHQANIKVVGYVHSNYSNRDLQAVKSDIDLYLKHFNVDGIFIDEVASNQEKLNYYHQIYQHIKSQARQYQVIINPGTDLDESYVRKPVADVAVIFEHQQREWQRYHPPAYLKSYPPQRFSVLVHSTASNKLMKMTLDRAVKYRIGYVYVTSDRTDTNNHNPWDSLPNYWHKQVDYIQKINATK